MKTRDLKRMAKQLLKCRIETMNIQAKEEREFIKETATKSINGKGTPENMFDRNAVKQKVYMKYKELYEDISRKQFEIRIEYKSKCDYKGGDRGGEKVMYCFCGEWREGVVMDMELTYWGEEIITIRDKKNRMTRQFTYIKKNVKLKK